MSPGSRQPLAAGEVKITDSPLESSEETQLTGILILAKGDAF